LIRRARRSSLSRCLRHPVACAGLLAIGSAVAAGGCKDDSICVDTISRGSDLELRARNLREFPITYTLKLPSGSRTGTLAPRQTRPVVTIHGFDAGTPPDYSLSWSIGDEHAVHDEDHLYSLPYASGLSYRLLQGFGSRFSHTGLEEFAIDVDMEVGTPVHAARGGVVARLVESNDKGCWEDGCGKFANFIVVLHNDGTTGEYYHLMKDGAVVAEGDAVSQGQLIGYSGNTGHTAKPHLHFAVYRGGSQSVPVRFQTADGIIDRPRRGARYQAQ